MVTADNSAPVATRRRRRPPCGGVPRPPDRVTPTHVPVAPGRSQDRSTLPGRPADLTVPPLHRPLRCACICQDLRAATHTTARETHENARPCRRLESPFDTLTIEQMNKLDRWIKVGAPSRQTALHARIVRHTRFRIQISGTIHRRTNVPRTVLNESLSKPRPAPVKVRVNSSPSNHLVGNAPKNTLRFHSHDEPGRSAPKGSTGVW